MGKKGNGEGSVYKDKQGRWRGVVTLYCDSGIPKRKYFYRKTKREPDSAKLKHPPLYKTA